MAVNCKMKMHKCHFNFELIILQQVPSSPTWSDCSLKSAAEYIVIPNENTNIWNANSLHLETHEYIIHGYSLYANSNFAERRQVLNQSVNLQLHTHSSKYDP